MEVRSTRVETARIRRESQLKVFPDFDPEEFLRRAARPSLKEESPGRRSTSFPMTWSSPASRSKARQYADTVA